MTLPTWRGALWPRPPWNSHPMPKVLIVKSNLEAFRVPFYCGLEKRLAQEGVELCVAVPRNRCGKHNYSWLLPVRGFELSLAGKSICWQGASSHARAAELVVVQQSARELTTILCLPSGALSASSSPYGDASRFSVAG